jgi:hypothetical protein
VIGAIAALIAETAMRTATVITAAATRVVTAANTKGCAISSRAGTSRKMPTRRKPIHQQR